MPEEIERGNRKLIFFRQMVVENCLEPRFRYFEGVGVYWRCIQPSQNFTHAKLFS